MRFENEGKSLWYGTADAPAPDPNLAASRETVITVGVSPVDPSNHVQLFYRVNHGPVESVAASWLRTDATGKAQYFRGFFPSFQAGDVVEYVPVCGCAGRQVPSPEVARGFTSSFQIGDAQANAALKPAVAPLNLSAAAGQVSSTADARSNGGASTVTKSAVSNGSGILPQPNPLAVDSRRATTLEYASLSGLDQRSANALLEKHLTYDRLNEATLSQLVAQGVLNPRQKADLQLTLQVGKLTGGNLELTRVLQKRGVRAPANLARYTKEDWRKLLQDEAVQPPMTREGKQLSVDEYARQLTAAVGRAAPTAVFLDRFMRRPASADADTRAAVGKLGLFFDKNLGLDLRTADFHKSIYAPTGGTTHSPINWEGIGPNQAQLLTQLKTFQRVLRIHSDPEVAERLLSKGFNSARSIAGQSETNFLAQWSGDEADGRTIYQNAVDITERSALIALNARDTAASRLGDSSFAGNPSPDLIDYFRSIPGFSELFSLPAFCDCAECKSMFGPAAYFVDLMRFVDLNITGNNPHIPSGLALKDRRPDLWEVPLDCENSTKLVPLLDIANEVLEQRMTGTYGIADPHRALLDALHPLDLRFNLPLERMRTYLSHFGKPLHQIFKTCDRSAREFAVESLGLCQEEFQVITTSNTYDAYLRSVYGVPAPPRPPGIVPITLGSEGNFWYELVRVDQFLLYTGLSRKELNRLLFQNLDKAEQAADVQRSFFINNVHPAVMLVQTLEPSLAIDTVTSDSTGAHEEFRNLSNQKLDRIHRFVRLARKLGWSFEDLDWALRSIGKAGPDQDIDEDAIIKLAKIKEWHERFKVPVEIICAQLADIKDIGRSNPDGKDPRDLFNRTFNNPDILGGKPPYTFNLLRKLSPNDAKDPNRSWLLAALEISEPELSLLLKDAPAVPLVLNKLVLSRLYRLSRLPKLLGLWTRDFLQLVDLMGIRDLDQLKDFTVLEQLFDTAVWLKASRFNVFQLKALQDKAGNAFVSLSDPEANVRLLPQEIADSLAANVIADSQLTAVKGLAPADAPKLFDNLVGKNYLARADPHDRQGRLTDKFTPEAPGFTLNLDKPFDQQAQDVMAVLLPHDPKQIVLDRLAAFLGSDPALINRLISAAGHSLSEAGLLGALTTSIPATDPVPPALTLFLAEQRAYQLLLSRVRLEPEEIAHATAHPQSYNIDSIGNLSLANVRRLHQFATLARSLPDAAALRDFFDAADRDTMIIKLISLLNRDAAQVRTVVDAGWPGANNTSFANVQDLAKIKDRLDLAAYFGIPVETLFSWAAWNSGDWAQYQRTADSALETLKAKYGEAQWKEKYEPFHDQIRERQRDALASFVMAQERGNGITSIKDLYKYFLIDVEMTSCARVSRIAQAMLSVQLYIQRCQLNLEREVDPASIPPKEWQWMKNYRVWEANRQVFLYPENYIFPELRDDKTPIFKELEDELLQADVTCATVEKAYRNYLDKFAEVANLKTAGAYYDYHTQTLFLVGRTKTEPRKYYYRKYVNQATWTPWEKIDLSIKADDVSPIFAFDRLFLFWVERRKPTADEPQTVRGSIKFSYYDFLSRWAHPQTMSLPIKNDDNNDDPLVHSLWDKFFNSVVYPYLPENIPSNYIRIAAYKNDYESIVHGSPIVCQQISPGIETCSNPLMYPPYAVPTFLAYDLREIPPSPGRHFQWPEFSKQPTGSSHFSSFPAIQRNPGDHSARIVYGSGGEFENWDHYFWDGLVANLGGGTIYADLLDKAPFQSSEIKVINNSGWTIFDSGLEEFLITNVDSEVDDLKLRFVRITTDTVHELSGRLFRGGDEGVEALLSPDSQALPELPFGDTYGPTDMVTAPSDTMDFKGVYGQYFEEIFFHIPLLIANRLQGNQRFEDAQKWYQYIFNPTIADSEPGVSDKDRVWRYLPFRNPNLLNFHDMLNDKAALAAYRTDPFKPHHIARLRDGVYQKTVVMKYIDNLISWAEALFAEDRWESVTEATLLYVLAWEILGGRPLEELDPCATPPTRRYQDLANAYQGGSNIPEFWIEVENAPILVDRPILGRTGSSRSGFGNIDPVTGRIDNARGASGLGRLIDGGIPAPAAGLTNLSLVTGNVNPAASPVASDRPGAAGRLRTVDSSIGSFNKAGAVKGIDNLIGGRIPGTSLGSGAIDSGTRISGAVPGQVGTGRSGAAGSFGTIGPVMGGTGTSAGAGEVTLNQAPSAVGIDRSGAAGSFGTIDRGIGSTGTSASAGGIILNQAPGSASTDRSGAGGSFGTTNPGIGSTGKSAGAGGFDASVGQPAGGFGGIDGLGDNSGIGWPFGHNRGPQGVHHTDSLLYFCFSDNSQLRDYWKRVQDGLNKIRHCLTIAGVKSERPLYDPPIDPLSLVKAVAAGRDISSVLAEILRPVSHYRFRYMIERAKGLAAQVQQLGAAFLSTLEKQDSEQLALLRSTHEQNILQMTLTLKEQQEDEAAASYDALVESRRSAEGRRRHYQDLISVSYNAEENAYFDLAYAATILEAFVAVGRLAAAGIRLAVVKPDGSDFGQAAEYSASALSATAGVLSMVASIQSVKGGFSRRAQDWNLQLELAQHDVAQLDSQVEAAGIRKKIAEIDRETQEKNIDQAAEQEAFLKDKFTNRELYQWMTGQLAGVYFQSYRLAYDLAKAAERGFQFERNTADSYITFGHWDSLKKGLLAGEMLMLELNRLEKAYLEADSRGLEIERTIPLSQLANDPPGSSYPTALIALKETGVCEFTLPNTLFELDYPGHYCRQIKSIAVTIPAVVGPYQNLKATLTQTSSRILIRPDTSAFVVKNGEQVVQATDSIELDPSSINVRTNWRSQQQIAISTGVNDSGQFQLNFGDDRYLPFEGTGVNSIWRLEIPKRTNVINLSTVPDVLVHIRYTARFDGGLQDHVTGALTQQTGYTVISLRPDESTAWYSFMNPNAGSGEHQLRLSITPALLPPNATDYNITSIFCKCDLASVSLPLTADLPMSIKPGNADVMPLTFHLSDASSVGGVATCAAANPKCAPTSPSDAFGDWRLTIDRRTIPPELRRQAPDGTTTVEVIGGSSCYLLDPDKFKNLQLVLIHRGTLVSNAVAN